MICDCSWVIQITAQPSPQPLTEQPSSQTLTAQPSPQPVTSHPSLQPITAQLSPQSITIQRSNYLSQKSGKLSNVYLYIKSMHVYMHQY